MVGWYKMSDEEAIEILKNSKKLYLKEKIDSDILEEAIETLLTAYEKQQKEIEELKEERKKYPIAMNDEQYKKVIELAQKDIKEELDRQINVRMINEEYIERNYISKDKIKAKIEELENMYNKLPKNPKEHLHTKTECKIIIGELQSLLKKE